VPLKSSSTGMVAAMPSKYCPWPRLLTSSSSPRRSSGSIERPEFKHRGFTAAEVLGLRAIRRYRRSHDLRWDDRAHGQAT
jgi:hypothetical protein